MKIHTVQDVVVEAVKKRFKDGGLDYDNWEHDITCFNDTGTRATVIVDKGNIERTYIVAGLMVSPDHTWHVYYFKQAGSHDAYNGIDAMCDADAWLQNHD